MASNHIESNTLQFSEDMEKPHILVIATGGTIASKESELGLTPVMSGEELVSDIPGIRNVCTLDVIQLMNIDSTNMRPCQWLKIRDAIMEHYNCYDGFVILHGTDTMAYTAAALSYLIQNSKKPIILTGSQNLWEIHTQMQKLTFTRVFYMLLMQNHVMSVSFSMEKLFLGHAVENNVQEVLMHLKV